MRRAWTAVLCLAAMTAVPAAASGVRPYRVDDLLALESIGQVRSDPGERVVLVERRRRYDKAADFSYGYFVNRLLSHVYAAPLDHLGSLAPLFPQEADAGYWMGDFSPSGRRLTVFRLAHRRLDLGVVDMATRRVVWLSITPDLPIAHPAPAWVDDDTIVAVAMRKQRLPLLLSNGSAIETDLPPLWAAASTGAKPSSTTVTTSALSSAGEREVVHVDLRTGHAEPLATGHVSDITASSQGHVAVISAVAPILPPAGTLDQTFVPLRYALDIVGTSGARRVRIADDVLPGAMAWNDRGSSLAFVRRSGPSEGGARFQVATTRGDGSVAVWTAPVQPAVEDRGGGLTPHFRWAGDRLLVEGVVAGGASRWFAVQPDRPPVDLGAGGLAYADARTAWFLRSGSLWSVSLERPLAQSAAVRVVGAGVTSLDPYAIGTRLLANPAAATAGVVERFGEGLGVRALGAGGLGASTVRLSASGTLLAIGWRHAVGFEKDAHGVGTLTLSSARSPAVVLARINEHLAARPLPRVVRLVTRMSDGRSHAHWLFVPPDADPLHPPPVVALVYPGLLLDDGVPKSAAPSAFAPMTDVPVLVGHGVAVLMPSLPPMRDGPDPLGRLAADTEGALDAAIARRLVDPTRVAVMGHSFGGYGALAIGERSARFRGIVAVSGPYDLAAAHGQMAGPDRLRLEAGLPFASDAGWAEGGQAQMGLPPWSDPARYVARSPSFALDRIAAPVLLAGGETDVVSLEQAERAFMGLARLGHDATLVRYWGEGHVLASPANIRDYWARILAWLDERFRSAGPPPSHAASQ